MAVVKRPGKGAPGKSPAHFWVELPLWLLVILVPIVVDPDGNDVFREVKLHVAEILALLSIAAVVWKLRGSDRSSSVREWIVLPAVRISLLVLVAAGMSLSVTQEWDYSAAAFFELAIGASCLVAWSLGWEPARLRAWLGALILPAVVLAGIGTLQYHHIWEPFDFLTLERSDRIQLTSLAGASSDLAAFLVLPILIIQAAIQRQKKRRWLLVPMLVLLVYTLILTQSFTAISATLAGTVLFWVLTLPRRSFLTRGGILLSLVIVAVLAFAPLRGRVAHLGDVISKGEINAALSGRLDAWRAATAMWSEHPVLGVGHGAFRAEFGLTKLKLEEQGEAFFRRHIYSNFSFTHNDYLQVLAEWGLLGFLALLGAMFLLIREALKLSSSTTNNKVNRSLALAGMLSMAVVSTTYFPWHLAMTAYAFILFLSWILALRREQEAAAG